VPTRDRVGVPRFGNRIRANLRIFRALALMFLMRQSLVRRRGA
jgi:hypothetical protein